MKWFCDWNTKEFDDYYCVFLDIVVIIVRAGTISAKMQGIGNPVSWVHLPTVRSGLMGTQVGKNRLRWIEVGNGKSRWANVKKRNPPQETRVILVGRTWHSQVARMDLPNCSERFLNWAIKVVGWWSTQVQITKIWQKVEICLLGKTAGAGLSLMWRTKKPRCSEKLASGQHCYF